MLGHSHCDSHCSMKFLPLWALSSSTARYACNQQCLGCLAVRVSYTASCISPSSLEVQRLWHPWTKYFAFVCRGHCAQQSSGALSSPQQMLSRLTRDVFPPHTRGPAIPGKLGEKGYHCDLALPVGLTINSRADNSQLWGTTELLPAPADLRWS